MKVEPRIRKAMLRTARRVLGVKPSTLLIEEPLYIGSTFTAGQEARSNNWGENVGEKYRMGLSLHQRVRVIETKGDMNGRVLYVVGWHPMPYGATLIRLADTIDRPTVTWGFRRDQLEPLEQHVIVSGREPI
jgi:hypothetical protein